MNNRIKKFTQFLTKKNEVIIRKMEKRDVQKCLDIKYQYFGHFYGDVNDPETKVNHDEYAKGKLDLSVSLIAEKNGEIVGGYFLKKTKLPVIIGNFYDFTKSNMVGIEGVSLFVHPDYKSEGIGHKLKYYYKDNKKDNISFIWGQAFHGLNNMNHWLKNRILFNDLHDVFFTIEFYNGTIDDFPKTKYLKFYNDNKEQAINIIEDLLSEMSEIDIIDHMKTNYDFDITSEEIDEIIKSMEE